MKIKKKLVFNICFLFFVLALLQVRTVNAYGYSKTFNYNLDLWYLTSEGNRCNDGNAGGICWRNSEIWSFYANTNGYYIQPALYTIQLHDMWTTYSPFILTKVAMSFVAFNSFNYNEPANIYKSSDYVTVWTGSQLIDSPITQTFQLNLTPYFFYTYGLPFIYLKINIKFWIGDPNDFGREIHINDWNIPSNLGEAFISGCGWPIAFSSGQGNPCN